MPPRENPRPEALTFNTEQVAAMFQAFQGAQRAAAKRQDPEAHRANFLMEFIKLKPPVFEGSSESIAPKRWLRKVKKKLEILGVPNEYRVRFATYLFEGSAEDWWDSLVNDCNKANLSWDEFETLFRTSYISEPSSQEMTADRQEKIAEFSQLVQGDMTVAQYHGRFVELSCYDLSALADPDSMCVKFRRGLRRKIRKLLAEASSPLTDFTELVAAAQRIEAELYCGDHKGLSSAKKKMGKKDQLRGRNSQGSGRSGSSASPIGGRYQPYGCYNCGQIGHKQQSCPHWQQQSPFASRGQ